MRESAAHCSNHFVTSSPCAAPHTHTNVAAHPLARARRRHALPLLRRALAKSLACVSLVAMVLPSLAGAQEVARLADKSKTKTAGVNETSKTTAASADARPRRIASLRTRETAEGARVTLTSDAELNNYAAYESGGRFFVRIPQADAGETATLAASLRGASPSKLKAKRSPSEPRTG